VDTNTVAELAGLHGRDPRNAIDGRFGAGITGDGGKSDGGRDRGDIDNGAALAGRAVRPHRPEGVLDAEADADNVDVAHATQVLGLHIDQQRGDLDARVIDQDVVATERGNGGRDRLFPLRVVRHVERNE